MTGFDSEADRRDAIRKEIVDEAYQAVVAIIMNKGVTFTPEENTYFQAAILNRLAKGLCMEAMSAMFRQEIDIATKETDL